MMTKTDGSSGLAGLKTSLAACGLAMLAALGAGTAKAADLGSRPDYFAPPEVQQQPFTWTGFYVGGHAGFQRGHDKVKEFYTFLGGIYSGTALPYDTKGWVAGIHGGANYQINSVVLGVVADIDTTSLRGGFNDAPNLLAQPVPNFGGIGTMDVKGAGSIRARLGYAFDRWHIYATGGLAVVNAHYYYYDPSFAAAAAFVGKPVNPNENTTRYRTGLTAGFGLEYAFNDHWIGQLEYRQTNLTKFKYDSKVAYPGLLTGQQVPQFNSFTVGVSYKF